jgi:alpha,alpha-trehalase
MDDLCACAVAILRRNDRGGYSVPTDGLYPFQWNWDSGFAAMGYGCFDEARAWRELERLLEGQWPDGMVPHIVFHREDPRYFPGPEVWGTARAPRTSGITQPPILAVCARRLLERARDQGGALAALRRLFPKLLAYHRWYHGARDPDGTGLVALYHPWETGMDNSPAWDGPLARVPVDPLPAYERRDTGHVDASQRPRRAEYDRYLTLLYRFRARGYEARALYAETPFRITDVGVNSILHRADRDLLALAQDLGVGGRDELEGWIERGRVALQGLWSEVDGGYRSRDQLTGETLAVGTSASLLPLFACAVPPERAPHLVATLERWAGQVRFLVPGTDPASPLFEPRRYWRGPVWLIVNWMIADGLAAYGRADQADRLRQDALELVATSGFWEYFDPVTGEGLGGPDFTWTAAATLFWLLGDPRCSNSGL